MTFFSSANDLRFTTAGTGPNGSHATAAAASAGGGKDAAGGTCSGLAKGVGAKSADRRDACGG